MPAPIVVSAAERIRHVRDAVVPLAFDATVESCRSQLSAVRATAAEFDKLHGQPYLRPQLKLPMYRIMATMSGLSAEIARILTTGLAALEGVGTEAPSSPDRTQPYWWLDPDSGAGRPESDAPMPAEIAGVLGSLEEWPDPSHSPAERARRTAAGLSRGRAVVGATVWKNAHLAGLCHRFKGELAERYPDGVDFSYEGFPIFEPHAEHVVILPGGFGPTRADDARAANSACGLAKTPRGMVWHHKEDGRTMLLVDKHLHESVGHWGGWRVYREARAREEDPQA